MTLNDKTLKNDERAIFALRSLYDRYGYSRYKMNKFEEYDLYVRNKDFLISDSVITFTDTNGKLMALKPDVTLSIIKNCDDAEGTVQKMYYNENVYRVSKGALGFREIMQVGLECIGDIDDYCVSEVLLLAAESLMCISDEWVLDISHLGILTDIIDSLGVNDEQKKRIIKCVGEKNLHELDLICENNEALKALITTYGDAREVIKKLSLLPCNPKHTEELTNIAEVLESCGLSDKVRIDFSIVDDIKYYNGIVFKGFINGVPSGILSGGRYDNLMRRMGKKSGAIGFAVYLDLLEGLGDEKNKFDVDVLMLYDENEPAANVCRACARMTECGSSVTAQRKIPQKLRYKKLMKLKDGEVTVVENNA